MSNKAEYPSEYLSDTKTYGNGIQVTDKMDKEPVGY